MKRAALKEGDRVGSATPAKDADFEPFWLFYLRGHSKPVTRRLHFIAISFVFIGLAASLLFGDHGRILIVCIIVAAIIAGATHRWSSILILRCSPTRCSRCFAGS